MKDAKQEILDAITEIETFNDEDCERIRAILETHTLEPIDDRPFDPTLCGFVATDIDSWESSSGAIIEQAGAAAMELSFRLANCITIPWPATQSDGERLLKLLGVLK